MAGSGRDSRKGWFAGGIVYLTSLSYQVKQTVQTNYVLCPVIGVCEHKKPKIPANNSIVKHLSFRYDADPGMQRGGITGT